MNIIIIKLLIFFIFGILIVYVPAVLVDKDKWLTRKELLKNNPGISWIKWIYPTTHTIWILGILVLSIFLLIAMQETLTSTSLDVLALVFYAIALFDSTFSLISGIRPIPTNFNYYFVTEKKAKTISLMQAALSLAGIIIIFSPMVMDLSN